MSPPTTVKVTTRIPVAVVSGLRRRHAGGEDHRPDVDARREHAGERAEHLIGDERDEADRDVEEVADAEAGRLAKTKARKTPT